jgi:nucleotide-sensitive chloride channel 1A
MAAFAASVITASPTFISPEEHAVVQASTPTSFDIPPVLRKKQADVRLQLNPPLEGFPEPSQGDGIKGDLYVTTE